MPYILSKSVIIRLSAAGGYDYDMVMLIQEDIDNEPNNSTECVALKCRDGHRVNLIITSGGGGGWFWHPTIPDKEPTYTRCC